MKDDYSENLSALYKCPSLGIDHRVENLLSHMTLEEKVAQMSCIWNDKGKTIFNDFGKFDSKKAVINLPHGIGQIARPSEVSINGIVKSFNAKEMAELTNEIQRFFIEETRLGIPVLFHDECLHGHMAKDGTSFPVPIALACTWDEELVEEVFVCIAEETRCRGGHLALTPVVDTARDPRWGRFEETFGEDPHLTGKMATAAVIGLQGRIQQNDKIDNKHIGATLKHLAGHGQPESGINAGPGNFTVRNLRESVLAPFKECIQNANPVGVMVSYNEIDGVPSHANSWLVNDILRGEWSYTGCVVSDYFGIQQLYELHHIVDGPENAAIAAIKAGIDIEFPDRVCYPFLINHIKSGKISIEYVNKAVARLLNLKFKMGLFDNPYVDIKAVQMITGNDRKRQLALKSAEKSIVLLKNDNNLLPLNISKYKTIGVFGPNADKILLGGYSDVPMQSISLLDGIREKVGDECKIIYSEGCRITEDGKWSDDFVHLPNSDDERDRLNRAYEAALICDIIILAIGGNELICREAWSEKHLGDTSTLDLIGNQNELVKRICETGKPVIVTLFHGRPQSIKYVKEVVPAILDCWYLGQECGHAVANIIFGDCSPGGKLPASIPRSVGHIPAFYNYKPTARRGYLFDDVTPLFHFGYGLSYTSFSFSNPKLANNEIKNGQSTSISIDVKNVGSVTGCEVVQMYIRDCVSSVTRPVKELKGFKNVSLIPGETKTITFPITPEKLAFFDCSMKFTCETGEFDIMIGNSSRDEDLKRVILRVI